MGLPPSSAQPVPPVYGDVPVYGETQQKPLPPNPASAEPAAAAAPAPAAAPEQPATLYPDLFQDAGANSAPVDVLPSNADVVGTAPPAE